MTKFLNISTDNTLGGNSPSDETVSSQKALKTYIDAHSSGSPSWGSITGTLSNQTDLQTALNAKQDEATAVNYDNISNCITEIPQDIKLELNNGTLTLKAGSKVYVPNGAGVFDEIIINSDLTKTDAQNSAVFLVYDITVGALRCRKISESYSGSTAPTSSTQEYWYDTTNNKIGISSNTGSSWTYDCSFPLAVLTSSSTQITSIDQVFNGFGYIGSTVFALPGIKGLIPNGRNADGSLKNIEVTKTNVEVFTSTNNFDFDLSLFPDGDMNTANYNNSYYDEDNNIYYVTSSHKQAMTCGRGRFTSSGVLFLETKSVYRALDYSDSPTIAGWAMPSDRYIDVTLGSSGSTYKAPANGWFVISKNMSSNGQFVCLENSTNGIRTFCRSSTGTSDPVSCILPVKKNASVTVYYNAAGALQYFRFVYAEGEQ